MRTTSQWTPEKVKELLSTNHAAVERAIIVIYNRQTTYEQNAEITNHNNGRGFTAFDAKRGSYYAKWINSGRTLSGIHVEKARKIATRYIRQLIEEIELKNNTKEGQLKALQRIMEE
jgi:hypothetical protein